jgi:hypothetical protein
MRLWCNCKYGCIDRSKEGERRKVRGLRLEVGGDDIDLKNRDVLANISSDDNFIHSSFRVIGGENDDWNCEDSGQA